MSEDNLWAKSKIYTKVKVIFHDSLKVLSLEYNNVSVTFCDNRVIINRYIKNKVTYEEITEDILNFNYIRCIHFSEEYDTI